jgi:hypothetical protein
VIRSSSLPLLLALLPAACGSPSGAVVVNSEAASSAAEASVAVVPSASSASAKPLAPAEPSSDALGEDAAENGSVAQSGGADHATVNEALKRELVGTGKIDGSTLTDVRMTGRCSTAFVTAKSAITVNWTEVGNFAKELDKGVATLPIADDKGRHVFTLADGLGFRRIDGGMGLLSDDCQS